VTPAETPTECDKTERFGPDDAGLYGVFEGHHQDLHARIRELEELVWAQLEEYQIFSVLEPLQHLWCQRAEAALARSEGGSK
jgi:hypothetical protein